MPPAADRSEVPLSSPLLSELDPICVSITGHTPAQMKANAVACLPAFPFQELRLDYLADPVASVADLSSLLTEHADVRFLATCRTLCSGGLFHGSAQQELEVLLAAASIGAHLVDLSLESAETLGPNALQQLRDRGAAVLLSFHDFAGTPDLPAVLARMRPFGPDIYKIVPTAQSLSDNLQVFQLLATAAEVQLSVVALSMSECGTVSRILGPRGGSLFTFGAATESEATAPGQFTAETLRSLFRIGQTSAKTRLFGVAGDPIRSSLSPLMLNTAFQMHGTDAVYLPLKTASAEELFHVAHELGLEGFSVTMPLKQAVMPLLASTDPLAARIGAVNTVRRDADGQFHGFNTDAAGILVPLQQRLDLQGARVLVLGAGGAARAAVFACADAGAAVSVYNRTASAAQALAAEAGAVAVPREALATETFDVLIQATPAGMRGNPHTLPLESHELRARIVFDLVYNPLETPLLALARTQGLEVIQGVEMFVHQGARQFELWTGQPAPVTAMQAAVLEHLQRVAG